jgi:hypothetical protein
MEKVSVSISLSLAGASPFAEAPWAASPWPEDAPVEAEKLVIDH